MNILSWIAGSISGILLGIVIVRSMPDRFIKRPELCPKCGSFCKVAPNGFRVCTRCPFFEWY